MKRAGRDDVDDMPEDTEPIDKRSRVVSGGAAGAAAGAGAGAGAGGTSTALVAVEMSQALIAKAEGKSGRTSKLIEPSYQLEGHSAPVYRLEFDPTGQHIASSSKDKSILLWDVYGDCENYCVMKGHKNAVLDIHWSSDGSLIYSASADKTLGMWDAEVGRRMRKFEGHKGVVNACSNARRGPNVFASASDDSFVFLWDGRKKRATGNIAHEYQVTAVAYSDDSTQLFTGGIDNVIRCFDIRTGEELYSLEGHTDTITYLTVSPNGKQILSNAMDHSVRAWDVQPFCATDRCLKTFVGGRHDFQKQLLGCAWSPNGQRVTAASSDSNMYIWDFSSTAIQYTLPGHKGCVNDVGFHPIEPIVASCSNDNTVFMGEISAV